jgi:hypothetical protein
MNNFIFNIVRLKFFKAYTLLIANIFLLLNIIFPKKIDIIINNLISWILLGKKKNNKGIPRGYGHLPLKIYNEKYFKWQPDYPETTGYIISSLIKVKAFEDKFTDTAIIELGDWLISLQKTDGSFKGGVVSSDDSSCIFDTGQIIRGLTDLFLHTNEKRFLDKSILAANWILDNEDKKSGYWYNYNSKSVSKDIKTFNVYAIDPIAKLGKITNNNSYLDLSKRVADFTLTQINENYSINNCELWKGYSNMHTYGYVIEGLFNLGLILNHETYVIKAKNILDQISKMIKKNGFLNGSFDNNWREKEKYCCLPGSAQIANMLVNLYKYDNNITHLNNALKIYSYLKNRQNNSFDKFGGGLGAISGSWPINKVYCPYQSISWATKFMLDLCINLKFLSTKVVD